MKKTNFFRIKFNFVRLSQITSLSLLIITMVLVINSCTKDVASADTATLETRSELTPIQRVDMFRPISEGKYESGRTHTLTDAVLGIETLLNYQYGDFSVPCDVRYRLTDTITVTKPNTVVGDDVVQDIYEEVLHEMECHYASVDGQKKELFVDLEVVGETNTAVQVGFTNVFGTVASIITNTKTFVTGDDWNAIYGRCYEDNPYNAPRKIRDYTNWNLVGQYSNQVGTWFSDFEKVWYTEDDYWLSENENDPIPGDNIIDYHLWNASTSNPVICCLEYDEMNYYLGNAQYEAKRYEPIKNKVFRHIEMDCEFTIGGYPVQNPGSPLTHFRWWGEGEYAKKNIDRAYVLQLGPCL